MEMALELYLEAGACERRGDMKNAIKLYRLAFKIDPEIDRKAKPITLAKDKDETVESMHLVKVDTAELVQIANPTEYPRQYVQKSKLLDLPDEILTNVIKWAIFNDIAVTKTLCLICRKISLLTKDPMVWSFQCNFWYRSRSNIQLEVLKFGNYYTMFLKMPRARLDGVYISKVAYLRNGLSLDLSYNVPTHLVTYFRYIRFLTLNSFLICTTPEEPTEFVPVCQLLTRIFALTAKIMMLSS